MLMRSLSSPPRNITSSPRRRGPRKPGDQIVEVVPRRVRLLDQPQLPCAVPLLEPLLAGDRVANVVVLLEVDEAVHAVPLREPFGHVVFVHPDPLQEITRDADVEGAVAT